jgi:hypothetical protein
MMERIILQKVFEINAPLFKQFFGGFFGVFFKQFDKRSRLNQSRADLF